MVIADVPKRLTSSARLRERATPNKLVPLKSWTNKADQIVIFPAETKRVTIQNDYVKCEFEYTTR